jgi:two-component system, chemotaxis family, response regulator Rcp1
MAASKAKPRGEGKGLSILLVDDDAGDCRLVQESLRDAKSASTVTVCSTGDAALEYLRKNAKSKTNRPNLVLLDLNMPGKDGFATLKEIRAEDSLTDMPVVILTTSTEERDVLQSYRMHANCFVSKPTAYEDFGAAVREIEAFWSETATLPQT